MSTAEDLVRFGAALTDGKLVKPETLKMMWTPSQKPMLNSGNPAAYGLGFGVLTIDGQSYIAYSGSQQGTSTDMEIIPERRLAVAVFTNNENAEPGDWRRNVGGKHLQSECSPQ